MEEAEDHDRREDEQIGEAHRAGSATQTDAGAGYCTGGGEGWFCTFLAHATAP